MTGPFLLAIRGNSARLLVAYSLYLFSFKNNKSCLTLAFASYLIALRCAG